MAADRVAIEASSLWLNWFNAWENRRPHERNCIALPPQMSLPTSSMARRLQIAGISTDLPGAFNVTHEGKLLQDE